MISERSMRRIYGCSYDEFDEIGLDVAKKFQAQRIKAKARGIEFLFTLPEWWKMWSESGQWDNRGVTGYVMCRFGDCGPYAIGNVHIATAQWNAQDGREVRRRKKLPLILSSAVEIGRRQ